MTIRLAVLVLFILLSISNNSVFAGSDWPMWRYDYNRSASTPEQLADKLHLQWQIKYPPRDPVWDDPLNRNLMKFDKIFEPVVADNKIFIGFNDQDKVVALDLNTGNEIWHYYADGPVRLPLAINKDKIYFTGDDGYCYCLNTQMDLWFGNDFWHLPETNFWVIKGLFLCGLPGVALSLRMILFIRQPVFFH